MDLFLFCLRVLPSATTLAYCIAEQMFIGVFIVALQSGDTQTCDWLFWECRLCLNVALLCGCECI